MWWTSVGPALSLVLRAILHEAGVFLGNYCSDPATEKRTITRLHCSLGGKKDDQQSNRLKEGKDLSVPLRGREKASFQTATSSDWADLFFQEW